MHKFFIFFRYEFIDYIDMFIGCFLNQIKQLFEFIFGKF